MSDKDNAPAFPTLNEQCEGMYLRDYFAAKIAPIALAQLIKEKADDPFNTAAKTAYILADTMMHARNQ